MLLAVPSTISLLTCMGSHLKIPSNERATLSGSLVQDPMPFEYEQVAPSIDRRGTHEADLLLQLLVVLRHLGEAERVREAPLTRVNLSLKV